MKIKEFVANIKKFLVKKKVKQPTLEDWLWVEVMLLQATICSISQNVRQIALCYLEGNWVIDVVLEQDSLEDREEISDIAVYASVYIEEIYDKLSDCANAAHVITNIKISKEELKFVQSEEGRLIFKRKER